jgi:hypothetical protein
MVLSPKGERCLLLVNFDTSTSYVVNEEQDKDAFDAELEVLNLTNNEFN